MTAIRRSSGADDSTRWRRAGWAAALGVLVLLVGYPLMRLLGVAATEARGIRELGGPLVNTAWTSLLVTVLAVGGGTVAAMVTERASVPGRRWLRLGMVAPLLVPPFVSALSWMRAYGPGGITDDLWNWRLPGLIGPVGVVVVIAVHALPLAYVVVAAALAVRADPDLERAARMSGAGGWATFRTVTLPLLAPAVLGAAALVFVSSANSFGIPAILGLPADFVTVTTRIYRDLAFSAAPESFARAILLATVLVGLAVLLAGSADAAIGRPPIRPSAAAGPALRRRSSLVPAIMTWAYLGLTTAVPFLALVAFSLTTAVGLPVTPDNWTLAHFGDALGGRFLSALGRSVLLAAVAATVVVGLGGLLASLHRTRGGRWLGTAALLAFAVPGSTLAVAMLLSYGRWLRDTLAIILLAYVAKLWAIGHRTVAGAADALSVDVRRAARASGATRAATVRTVVMPLLGPALAVAWLLVFLFGLHELTMSSLLYGPGTDTLAVVVLNLQQLGDLSVTSALAVILTLPVVVLAIPLLGRRRAAVRTLGFE